MRKPYYFYFQTSEKGKWQLGVDDPAGRKKAIEEGARRISILSLDREVTEGTEVGEIQYKGPFYVDIDCGDLEQSIASMRSLLVRLQTMQVSERHFEVYCSGTKGFHLYLHPKLFYHGRALADLPSIYKAMARELYVYGLDYQVYCGGKGNLFRIQGQREDGRFKVRVLPSDVETMTVERYLQITSTPNHNFAHMPMGEPQEVNPYCSALFQKALNSIKSEAKEAQKLPPVADSELQRFQKDPPPCIEDLCDGKTSQNTSLNQAAMQLGIFAVRSSLAFPSRDALVHRLAKSKESSSYPTPDARIRHTDGLIKYLESTPNRKFSCAAMRSVISTKPCSECALYQGGEEVAEEYEILEKQDGYHHMSGNGTSRRLTSFLLIPFQVVYSHSPGEAAYHRRLYVLAYVEQNGIRNSHPIMLTEEGWTSRNKFLGAFHGLSNLAIFGTDLDVQRLKHYILKDTEELDQQIGVNSVGIHRMMLNKKPSYTWVEDGYSNNKWGMRDTHLYTESSVTYSSAALPRLINIKTMDRAQHDYEAVIRTILALNEPGVILPLVGWIAAAVLKSHFMGLYSQFPLFNLWGGRGSGKTRTAAVLSGLHGCDYLSYAPMSLASGTTDFAIFNVASSTTTVLRVMDEFNSHLMRPGRYEHITGILMAAFNNSPIPKGRLRNSGEMSQKGGGVVEHHQVSSPILYLGEHPPEMPALVDRTYMVQMREPSIAGRQGYMKYLMTNRERIPEIGKALVLQGLQTRDDWLHDRMDEWEVVLSQKGYNERQAYTRQVIGTGLSFLRHTCLEVLKLNLEPEFDFAFSEYTTALAGPQAIAQQTGYLTEIDRLFSELGVMVAAGRQGTLMKPISPNTLWVEEDYLYFDPFMLFFHLEQHFASTSKRLPVRHAEQFKRLVSAESYFLSEEVVPMRCPNRPCLRLSLSVMAQKGIDVSLFQ